MPTDALDDALDRPSAFLTCAARSHQTVEPLIDRAERVLMDLGWRTRLPGRTPPREGTATEERRRLRQNGYHEIERADVLIHVPAGASHAGVRLHHELTQAVKAGTPVLLLIAGSARRQLGIEQPAPERVAHIVELTGASVVAEMDDLAPAIAKAHEARARA